MQSGGFRELIIKLNDFCSLSSKITRDNKIMLLSDIRARSGSSFIEILHSVTVLPDMHIGYCVGLLSLIPRCAGLLLTPTPDNRAIDNISELLRETHQFFHRDKYILHVSGNMMSNFDTEVGGPLVRMSAELKYSLHRSTELSVQANLIIMSMVTIIVKQWFQENTDVKILIRIIDEKKRVKLNKGDEYILNTIREMKLHLVKPIAEAYTFFDTLEKDKCIKMMTSDGGVMIGVWIDLAKTAVKELVDLMDAYEDVNQHLTKDLKIIKEINNDASAQNEDEEEEERDGTQQQDPLPVGQPASF